VNHIVGALGSYKKTVLHDYFIVWYHGTVYHHWYFQLKRRTSDMFLDHVSVMCLSVEWSVYYIKSGLLRK